MVAALPPDAPFVLLDDARPGASSGATLYRDPVEVVRADTPDALPAALARLASATGGGLHAAGYMAYEAGYALEPRLASLAAGSGQGEPLLWFGLFERAEAMPAEAVPALLPAPQSAPIGAVMPLVTPAAHADAVARVLAYIRAGDIYQANLTFPCAVALRGDPLAAYAAIRARAAAGHGALVRHDGRHLLSFSPERFFALEGGRILARPMKGTAARGRDAAEDAALAHDLATDAKQRAENLMIVDLLRNDISRIAVPGSVIVPELFTVETYPTIHQLVSVVEGTARSGLGPVDMLRALFPCGSITGAPKLRAMEVIAEIEQAPRGVYTGLIGAIAPNGAARFNVAIRTISVDEGGSAHMGLGSGIVADSVAEMEWLECLEKARFLIRR